MDELRQILKEGIESARNDPINAFNNEPIVTNRAMGEIAVRKAEVSRNLEFVEYQKDTINHELNERAQAQGVDIAESISWWKMKSGKGYIGLGLVMTCGGAALINYNLQYMFYEDLFMAILVSISAALAIASATELLLEFLAKVLTNRQFFTFITVTSCIFVCASLGGSIALSKARVLQAEISDQETNVSALELEETERKGKTDMEEKVKKH